MNEAFAVGLAHFAFVFFKAFQQRNVAFMHYHWIYPISFFMSATEVFVLSLVAVRAVQAESWYDMVPFAFALGVGGGTGAIAAMWLHHRFLGE